MTRHFWVLAHRFSGLYMAFFLIVAGLTGSVLAFYHELDRWLNPLDDSVVAQPKPMLDPFVLRDRALSIEPHGRINWLPLVEKPDEIYTPLFEPRIDPATGNPYELKSVKLNPYTGDQIYSITTTAAQNKEAGYWPLTRKNILAFIYEIHYSLALGDIGIWLFGIAATIWTLDCFVGFYLTLPMLRKKSSVSVCHSESSLMHQKCRSGGTLLKQKETTSNKDKAKSFWQRWRVAWLIKWPSSTQRFNFDLHRAGGLWTWPMLFVFAWSSVFFNLKEQVYMPVMKQLFEITDVNKDFPIPDLDRARPEPIIDFNTAYQTGKQVMEELARKKGFRVLNEASLDYAPTKGLYTYTVRSEYDIDKLALTMLWFDGDTGKLIGLYLPTGQKAGDTISLWLQALHMAMIWGLPYKVFVCFMGLMITMLSITGVYLWMKKRKIAGAKRVNTQIKQNDITFKKTALKHHSVISRFFVLR